MGEHRDGEILDIVRNDVGAIVGRRPHTGATGERKRTAHGRSDGDELAVARLLHQPQNILVDRVVDMHLLHGLAHVEYVMGAHNAADGAGAIGDVGLLEQLHAPGPGWVADRGAQQEAVHLRFGQ